jgi:hypothetical protein
MQQHADQHSLFAWGGDDQFLAVTKKTKSARKGSTEGEEKTPSAEVAFVPFPIRETKTRTVSLASHPS